METVSNVTVSVLTSGITMATVGTLLGVISREHPKVCVNLQTDVR